jgi:hypothetical protein
MLLPSIISAADPALALKLAIRSLTSESASKHSEKQSSRCGRSCSDWLPANRWAQGWISYFEEVSSPGGRAALSRRREIVLEHPTEISFSDIDVELLPIEFSEGNGIQGTDLDLRLHQVGEDRITPKLVCLQS